MRRIPFLDSTITLLSFLPAATSSGFFYWHVIRVLRANKGNNRERKVALARAFFCLWISWVVFTLPHVAFQLYFVNFVKVGVHKEPYPPEALIHVYSLISLPGIYLPRNSRTIVVVETALRILQQSYGFLNSVLLVTIMKPFQEPFRKLLTIKANTR